MVFHERFIKNGLLFARIDLIMYVEMSCKCLVIKVKRFDRFIAIAIGREKAD